jgi:TolB-like protein/Tfp pilus assembly protein PilF
VIIGVGGFFGYRNYRSTGSGQIDSIAVLPFENRSVNADTDYLSDGLSDSLIYRLTQLPNLKVSPTSSVMRYKGKQADVAEIAKELEVDAVMSGKLAQRGDDLTINVELVDTRTKKLIWAEQYDRKMSDLLATQREIATAIADKLQLKLSGDQARGITKKYTNNNEAYDLYMRARYRFAKRTKADMLQAADYYRQSVAIDPSFALAYARIAEVYLNLPSYPYVPPNEALPQGRAAVQTALELDPALSEAHVFNAFDLAGYEWKWPEAEREFKRAIELDPNSSAAHFRYGQMYLLPQGRFEEGIAEIKIALDTEPFDIVMGVTYAWAYLAAGEKDKALEIAKKTYDLEPDHPLGRHFMAMTLNAVGRYGDAIAICENALRSDPSSQFMLQSLGVAYASAGRRDKAEEVVSRFGELGKTNYLSPYGQAAVQVALGNRDLAFAMLEKAYQMHDWFLHRIKVDPYFAPLRGDPRYKHLLERLSLPA